MLRLLLVEDSASDRDLVRRGFRDPGPLEEPVEIVAVESVDEALAVLQTDTFAVILLDYALPKRTGLELIRALREANDPTPIIFLTGSGDVMLAVTALQDGAADFVVKDIAFERTLPVVVRRVLDKHASARADREARTRLTEHVHRLERQLESQTRELRRALQESEALRRVGQLLATTKEPSAALDVVSKTAAQLLQAQLAAVILRRGDDDVLVSAWGPVGHAPGLKRPHLTSMLTAGCESATDATMREEGEAIGKVWVGRTCREDFAPHEMDILEAIADLTALSIAKLRAREQLRRLGDAVVALPAAEHAPVDPVATAIASQPDPEPAAPLPLIAEPESEEVAPDATASILIVDDSEKVLLQARLALQESMTVLTATSGALALEKYAATRPAAVLVDLVMPDMDGFATLAALQKLGCASRIALAVRGDAQAHERARRAGCLAVIEKPFRPGELPLQIKAALASVDAVAATHIDDDGGYPVLTLPNPSSKLLPKLLPIFDRQLRTLAEEGNDRLILDGGCFSEITPEHVAMLVRVFSEAGALGIKTAICVPNDHLVGKLRQIVEIRDARYVATRDAAKACLQ